MPFALPSLPHWLVKGELFNRSFRLILHSPSEAAGVPLPRGEGRAGARPPARAAPVGEWVVLDVRHATGAADVRHSDLRRAKVESRDVVHASRTSHVACPVEGTS